MNSGVRLASSKRSAIRVPSSTLARVLKSCKSRANSWHRSVTLARSALCQNDTKKVELHLQTISPGQYINALTIRFCAMLAQWLLARTSDLLGATLKCAGTPSESVQNQKDTPACQMMASFDDAHIAPATVIIWRCALKRRTHSCTRPWNSTLVFRSSLHFFDSVKAWNSNLLLTEGGGPIVVLRSM
jgi:hypothetical protein